MANADYTDRQINDFLELAQDIGIGRALRELGYPKSWSTAQRWAKMRGIEVNVDELKQRSQAFNDWYQTEDVMLVAQEGIKRVYDDLLSRIDLSADEQKKLADALNKHYDVWAKAQGKATVINETRQSDNIDSGLIDLLNAERAKNALRKDNNEVTD